jgi:hypothetical protein
LFEGKKIFTMWLVSEEICHGKRWISSNLIF